MKSLIKADSEEIDKKHSGKFIFSQSAMKSIMESLDGRLTESREISRYLIGLTIFLGLLGTFWGLLETINSVGITSGGINYKVNDRLIFDQNVSNSSDAQARVTKLKGSISEISVSKESISDVSFFSDKKFKNVITGIASTSLNLQNGVTVNIGGLSTTRSDLLEQPYKIGISSTRLILSQGIGTVGATGVVTFFNVEGNLERIRTNDRFKVGLSTETVKVLEVDTLSSRIRVLRPVEAVGVSHTQSTILEEIPRVFTFSSGIETSFPVREDK